MPPITYVNDTATHLALLEQVQANLECGDIEQGMEMLFRGLQDAIIWNAKTGARLRNTCAPSIHCGRRFTKTR